MVTETINLWWNYTSLSYDILPNTPDNDEIAILYIPNSDICRNLYYKLRKLQKSPKESMSVVLSLFYNYI